jgi:FKBP-type peptidyl-prolyl cis-trans isomerase SlyD
VRGGGLPYLGSMKIENKRAVAIGYKLTIDDGILVDMSEPGQPLWYLHGFGNIIPGLESALEGLEVGDKKTVVVPPDQGYGEYEQTRVHQVPKTQFDASTKFNVGDRVTANAPDGRQMEARVKAISAKEITLDFNHELAGKTLTFEVEVTEVRKAEKAELDHGHIHGPGGAHH